MKSNLNIKTILVIAIIGIVSFIFLNNSLAANSLKVDVAVANIRENADADSTIIEQAARNETVEVLEKTDEWYKVKYNGKIGYVRKDLLEGETTTTTESTTTEAKPTPQVTETPPQETTNVESAVTPAETTTTTEPTATETTQTTNSEQENQPAQVEQTPTPTPAPDTTKSDSEAKEEGTGLYTCKENIKLKIIPLINGKDIKELVPNVQVNVLEINNKWALVDSESVRGWVLVSKIEKVKPGETPAEPTTQTSETQQTEQTAESQQNTETATQTVEEPKQEEVQQPVVVEKTMFVNSNVINLRSAETTDSDSIDQLKKGTQVTVVSENNGWSKVKVNGKEGYILSTLLTDRKPAETTSRNAEEPRKQVETKKTEEPVKKQEAAPAAQSTPAPVATSTGSATGASVVAKAKTYIGCKYVYGGTSPSGFDCSGFAQYIYKQFGISLNRTAAGQYSNGTAVSRANLQVGDLVMFGTSASNINHVGIYAGNGTIVHAANKQRGVTTDTINSGYYNTHYVGARRVLK